MVADLTRIKSTVQARLAVTDKQSPYTSHCSTVTRSVLVLKPVEEKKNYHLKETQPNKERKQTEQNVSRRFVNTVHMVCLCLCLCLSVCLSVSLPHAHTSIQRDRQTDRHTHTHTHTLSISLFLCLTHAHTQTD